MSVWFISKIGWIVTVDWRECMICFSNRLKMVHKRKFRVGREVINWNLCPLVLRLFCGFEPLKIKALLCKELVFRLSLTVLL